MKMENQIPAIQTQYHGVTFRSRLEAKWAAFFDRCDWPWQYEPIDLKGYIPDFILAFPKAPVLVEVKPELYASHLLKHTAKIEASGWDGEALIVGTTLFGTEAEDAESSVLGILAERFPVEQKGWMWDQAFLQRCRICNHDSFIHASGHWGCRYLGCYQGNAGVNTYRPDEARRLFAMASETVRWNP